MTKPMDNKELLTNLTKWNFEITRGREHGIKTMVQIGLLSDLYDVKNYEYDEKGKTDFESYPRKAVLSREDIIKRFNDKAAYYLMSQNLKWETEMSIKHFIGAVKMFDMDLANELIEIAEQHNIGKF